jgi:predicted RND superfamily exporter protein
MAAPSRLEAFFRRMLAMRRAVLAAFALLVPLGAWEAAHIRSDGSIGSLVMPSDPDYAATRAFQRVFPEGQVVLLLLEVDDPWRPEALAALEAVAAAARGVAGVSVYSAVDVYRQARPGFAATPEALAGLRRFLESDDLFRRQGLVGARHWGLAVAFPSAGPEARDATLAALDGALDGVAGSLGGARLRRVGAPYVESWIERESGQATLRWFPVFGLFVVGLALFLYRSVRALLAILLSLAAAVALGVGAGRALGFAFTVVSSLVPLTIMVTTLASLVYLHSRFVDQPDGVDEEAHRTWALANKFLPVTASAVAAVLGFAALSVSAIRPVREMGLWTALGLAIGWVVAFTLFPALQQALRAPTRRTVHTRTALFDRVADALPAFTFRWRWPLVVASLVLQAAGLVALLGWPGRVAPMRIGIDALDYVDPGLPIHGDMAWFRQQVGGLNVARAWVRVAPGTATEPEVLRGLDRFTAAAQDLPDVSAVVGPTTFLRVRRALSGQPGPLPQDPAAFAAAAGDVEALLLSRPELRAFIDVGGLSDLQVTVTFGEGDAAGFARLRRGLEAAWARSVAGDPAFEGASLEVVGEALLQAKVGASLVPTLTESFAITAALIFAAFLVVFRSAWARLMAMIPSLFAILCTFLALRLLGGSLNVATILIATTVLGTTENDQIHFFHHLAEGDGPGGLDGALRHALRVSGRAILFATLINAAGFLGLAFSRFPPLRQFGLETAGAFLLAMLADFTALPGALWIVRRERPRDAAGAQRGGLATRR